MPYGTDSAHKHMKAASIPSCKFSIWIINESHMQNVGYAEDLNL